MARRNLKVDPFAQISESEVKWQEVSEVGKDAVKGEKKEVLTWKTSRNASKEEIRQAWENRRAQKRIGPTRKEA